MNNGTVLEQAKSFLYKNGRLLDRRRYEYHFEGGSAEAVIDALRAYQNPDGGFGNALEADIRCPYSQPVPIEMALHVMDEVALYAPDVLDGIIRYLRGITLPGGGLPFVFRSASEYPHMPWWKTDRDDVASINPTGLVMGLLSKQTTNTAIFEEHWFLKNVAYVWSVIDNEQPSGYQDGIHWIVFLQHAADQERALPQLAKIDDWLQRPETIERDTEAEGYVHKVLDWAPARNSYAAKAIAADDLNLHLEALVRQQQDDGGWPICWPTVSPGAETEWRGWVTVERLKTLKSYGML
ncbi:prenyltransferase/squalene oxidase repeat-containing protein [Cohnella yongneupensis]|uniref:Prenyltransferase/squalene oxidase repeat-containing protein n=1 Tax=Cohnella yongneupensis TaxID=425006 RepID=A0ABW0QUW8_9BACL